MILLTTDASTRKAAKAAVKSAGAAETAVNNAQEKFRLEQRPILWLTNNFEPPHFRKTGDNMGRIAWTWHYTNYGKTPALKISYEESMRIESDVTPNFSDSGPAAPMPTNKEDLSTITSGLAVTQDQFHMLMKFDKAIGIIVKIAYHDAYNTEYETDFCLDHLATGLSMYCKEGNDIK